MIIKNFDYLFQKFSEREKHHKDIPQIVQTAKFLLRFYNNTRCNKINQMEALRMDWYSLISIHKSLSTAMLSECLMVLDMSREVALRTFETIS